MRIINETRTVPLTSSHDVTVEGLVRVRGLDARAVGRGFVYERHAPQAIAMVRAGSTQVQKLPRDGALRRAVALIAVPALALLLRRLLRLKG
jgi:hypothetical protein